MKDLTDIEQFNYYLPEDRIALFPCEKRDESKLLVYQNKQITESKFKEIPSFLNENHLLVFNNSKVIQARLCFHTLGGAKVEIFCLEPLYPSTLHTLAFSAKGETEWLCFIGNNKKLKTKLDLLFDFNGEKGMLSVERIAHINDAFRVKLSWQPKELTFAEVIEIVGKMPLPPYIKRQAEKEDKTRYQTIYAKENGSVAAPTAGLHFSQNVLENLQKKHIETEQITLHVGAGTFKPVNESFAENHVMHTEQLFFSKKSIERLLLQSEKKIIAVGTTTTRSLESLYWIGVKIYLRQKYNQSVLEEDLHLSQWEVYERLINENMKKKEALTAILNYMNAEKIEQIHASTAIMITPYYKMKMVEGLITNFHQPKSTLMLLISAFVGDDWKTIYNYALEHQFRFLSYGDACLFM